MCNELQPADEERMLRKLGADLTEVISAIFGAPCQIELNISGAPISKVALVQECNQQAAAGPHRVYLTAEDRFTITVCDTNYLPF